MKKSSLSQRRSFLSNLGSRITILGAAAAVVPATAAAQTAPTQFSPKRHTQDDWLEQIPGQHRLVFDTTQPSGISDALLYATNYFNANQSSYGLQNSDLAVVIIARHTSTPYGYNETIWSKYGEPISSFIGKEPSKANAYGRQINALVQRGVHFAVCQMATRALAGSIARSVNGNADDIFDEIAANLVPNSHLVPAGIVAVGRAQERGYSVVHA